MNSKKVMAFALAVISTCVCSASAFAYVSSPSHSLPAANKSGTTQGVEKNTTSSTDDDSSSSSGSSSSSSSSKSDDDVTYRAVGYSKNDTLDEAQQEEFTECYEVLKETTDLTELTSDIEDIAEDKDVKVSNTAVSDIFYSVLTGAESKTVKIKAKNLDKFVALLCYSDGEWSVVEGARIDSKGRLVFKAIPNAVYAIVIDTTEETEE